jgi:5-methylcytosine-specific restriction endonuclease McrA
METLKTFVSDSKTFNGFTFRGSYGMSNELFFKLFEYYQQTGENHLDAYSNLIYLSWEMDSDREVFHDYNECNKLREYVSISRRLKLFDIDTNQDFIRYIESCRKRFLVHQESQRNEPRKKACCYTARPEVKEWVFSKYGKICLCCGTTENISIDHIKPIKKGGTNDLDNLQPLCKSCNSSKSTRVVDYRYKAKLYFEMYNDCNNSL